jgi:hypothetical protein
MSVGMFTLFFGRLTKLWSDGMLRFGSLGRPTLDISYEDARRVIR